MNNKLLYCVAAFMIFMSGFTFGINQAALQGLDNYVAANWKLILSVLFGICFASTAYALAKW